MIVRIVIAVGVAIEAASPVAADPGLRVGAELGASYLQRDDKASDLTWVAPTLAVRAAYGLPDGLAVGVRAAVTRLGFARGRDAENANPRPADRYGELPIDLAATAQYVSGPQWVAFWLGWRVTRVTHEDGVQIVDDNDRFMKTADLPTKTSSTGLVTGLTGGYDLWQSGANRVGAFAELAVGAREHGEADRYVTISVGVAYHR